MGNKGINIKYTKKKLQNNHVIIAITVWFVEIVGFFNSIIPKKSQNKKEPIQYIKAAMECTIVASPIVRTGNKPIRNSPSEEKKAKINVILINP